MSDSSRRLRPVVLSVGVLVLAAAVAALGAWWWWSWWSPVKGEVFRLTDGSYHWYATPLDPGQAHVASSTFEYVVVGFVLALLVGVVTGVLGRNRPYLTLVLAALAGALGAWLMWQVGMSLSAPDPSKLADKAHFGKKLPGSLHVAGWTPYLAWPVGSLLGFLVVMLAITSEGRKHGTHEGDRPVEEPSAV